MLSFLLCLHNSKVATGGDLAVVDSYASPESKLSAPSTTVSPLKLVEK
jgi:hypothetical protein